MKDVDLITELTNSFLDRMPSKCKICLPDLVDSIWKDYQRYAPIESNLKDVNKLVREIAGHRPDFCIYKGRGLCKQ